MGLIPRSAASVQARTGWVGGELKERKKITATRATAKQELTPYEAHLALAEPICFLSVFLYSC